MEICIEMVQRLINEQYPEFMGLNIKSVEKSRRGMYRDGHCRQE